MSINDFLNALFGDLPDGEHVCLTKGKKFNQLATPAVLQEAQRGEWYFCVSSVNGREAATPSGGMMVRRADRDLVNAHVLVLDDVGEKTTSVPDVEPTYKLESSEGSFHHGYSIEPFDLSGEGLGYYKAVVAACIERGWSDEGAKGAARMMRVPGSVNTKTDKVTGADIPGKTGWKSVIREWHPERVWKLTDLVAELGLEIVIKPAAKKAAGNPRKRGAGFEDVVLAWLEREGHIVKDSGEWVEITCPWLETSQAAGGHTTGTTACYSPAGRGAGSWTGRRAFKCHHNHPERSETCSKDFLDWVEENGGPAVEADARVEIALDRYCLIENGNLVGDMYATAATQNPTTKLGEWQKARQQPVRREPGVRGPTPKLAGVWLSSFDTVHVSGITARPGEGRLISQHGEKLWNTWARPSHGAVRPNPGEFLPHIEHVIPDENDRELFLDWLAMKIQHPASRSFGIIMVADSPEATTYGIGRSMIGDVIGKLLQSGVPSIDLNDVIGDGSQAQFNEWAANAQVVIVEETKENVSQWTADVAQYERLKKLVDTKPSRNIRMKVKYGPIFQADLYCNYLFFTNHYDALRLPAGDRRFCVMANATHKRKREEYAALLKFIDSPVDVAGLYWWLMARDVSQFDAASPPMSEAKQVMQEAAVRDWEEMVAQTMESFEGDLVSTKAAERRLHHLYPEPDMDRMREIAAQRLRKQIKRLPKLKPTDRNGGRLLAPPDKAIQQHQRQPVNILRNVALWQVGEGDSPEERHTKEFHRNYQP